MSQKKDKHSKKLQKTKILTAGITSGWYYVIKYIAIIAMFLDHIGYIFSFSETTVFILRCIGRIAYPLFAFELVESFHFTKNRKKHLIKLGILAVISELPFDMAITMEKPLEFSTAMLSYQNVIINLFLGYIMLWLMNLDWEKVLLKLNVSKAKRFFIANIKITIFGLIAFAASLAKTDYKWMGILLICLFEITRTQKVRYLWQTLSLCCFVICTELNPIIYVSLILVVFLLVLSQTNAIKFGNKFNKAVLSKPSKLICCSFYPVHLAILAGLRIIFKV